MNDVRIRLAGLTKFDTRDLGANAGIEYVESGLEPDSHGEVTLFTAMISISLISTVAAFLLRKHNHQSFEQEIEIEHADGRIEKRRIRWSGESSEAPDAKVIAQIRGGFDQA